jgi:hypothetical protein
MRRTVIINNEIYTLLSYTKEELDGLRNICGFGPGYCECGCGNKVTSGRRFVRGHSGPDRVSAWSSGERSLDERGYAVVYDRNHPKAGLNGSIREHILVMERSLGRLTLSTEAIHHLDGNKANNSIGNLMLFKTHGMHHAYEARIKAFEASGYHDWRQCRYCNQWDDPINLIVRGGPKGGAFHPNRRTNKNCCG